MKNIRLPFLFSTLLILMFSNLLSIWAEAPTRAKIVFNSNRDGNAEIYVMDTDGRQQVRLTQHPDADFQPAWSPTGEKILFVSNRDGERDLYLMDADGENVQKVFRRGTSRQQPSWSPDGKQIAYLGNKGDDWAIYISSLGGKEERLAHCGRTGGFPNWSPDGTEIAFAVADSIGKPGSPLLIHNLHTGKQETLHPKPQLRMFNPSWTPDGSAIVFAHVEGWNIRGLNKGTIYVVNRDGSGLRRIVPDNEPITQYPVLARSGDALAYNKKVDENRQIFKIDLTSKQSKQLTRRGINVYPDWFDPTFALPVSPNPQLLTTVWAKVKTTD